MRVCLAMVLVAACGSSPMAPPPELPWLHGFVATAASDTLVRTPDGGGILQVTGDLAPSEGDETVAVSYGGGVVVRDRGGAVIARAPGFDETGSADDVVSVGIGDALIGPPLIAVAVTSGGHQISTTSLALYRLGEGGRLERVFFEPIEERDGEQTVTGSVTVLAGSLFYRAPGESNGTVRRYDTTLARYTSP